MIKQMTREKFEAMLYLKMRPDDVIDVMEAYRDAKEGHGYENQKRDGGERYFEHPRGVAIILMKEFGIFDPDMVISALLHDVVEDTYRFGTRDAAFLRLERRYNKRVATFVIALTKIPCEPEEKSERDQRYFKNILHEGPKTTILKLADRLHNLRTLSDCIEEKQRDYAEETEQYVFPLIEELLHNPLLTPFIRNRVRKAYKEMAQICADTRT